MIGEIWLPIKGYEDRYEASSYGRIRSYNKKRQTYLILKSYDTEDGYRRIWLRGRPLRVHRIVAEAFIRNPLNKLQVNHINGIKSDNRVENLEWATASENLLHAYKNKLKSEKRGTGNPRTKPLMVIDEHGNHVFTLYGAKEILNHGLNRGNIASCIAGRRKQHKGYTFKYSDD